MLKLLNNITLYKLNNIRLTENNYHNMAYDNEVMRHGTYAYYDIILFCSAYLIKCQRP